MWFQVRTNVLFTVKQKRTKAWPWFDCRNTTAVNTMLQHTHIHTDPIKLISFFLWSLT